MFIRFVAAARVVSTPTNQAIGFRNDRKNVRCAKKEKRNKQDITHTQVKSTVDLALAPTKCEISEFTENIFTFQKLYFLYRDTTTKIINSYTSGPASCELDYSSAVPFSPRWTTRIHISYSHQHFY